MSLFVLAETSAGYGLFKAKSKKLLKEKDLAQDLQQPERLIEMLKLKEFVNFGSAANALEEAASLREGQVPTLLHTLLNNIKGEQKASIAVADLKLGTAISNLPEFNITPVAGTETMPLFRAIREHISSLLPDLGQDGLDRTTLGLAHSMSRHQLKFSPDKVDSMIIQAIKSLDDLDKNLNVYAMRVKEWYGWHFPEMAKILNDNITFARVVLVAGFRSNIPSTDLSEILPEQVEAALKAAADISMGTDMTQEDLDNCQELAKEVVTCAGFRDQVSSFLESRMRAIAPNLTALVGFLVGARLIAHTGSILALAKAPASTIQILGAEKALFRALKTKHDTPKYGLIYHSSLVGQANGKNKGKIARMLSAKTALGLRVDVLGTPEGEEEQDEEARAILGLSNRIKLENALRRLEGKPRLAQGTTVTPSGEILTSSRTDAPAQFTLRQVRRYNVDADGVETANGETEEANGETPKKSKDKKSKDKKSKKSNTEVAEKTAEEDDEMRDAPEDAESDDEPAETPSKSSKKLSDEELERLADLAGISVKKFKRKYERGDVQLNADGTPKVYSKKDMKKLREEADEEEATPEKADKKKKKRKSVGADEAEAETKKSKKVKHKSKSSDA